MQKYDLNKNEVLEFNEKERDFEIQDAVNGLHSGTVISSKEDGRYTLELHWHPEKKILVEVLNWFVDGEDGDVMSEFEVKGIYKKVSDAVHLAAKYQ